MKIIDLLNKIAKGEEVPKKFRYDNNIFIYDEKDKDYIYSNGNVSFFTDYFTDIYHLEDVLMVLNDEVEIIEEEKDIEKLDVALLAQCDNWLQDQVTGEKSRFELNPYIINNIRENTLYFQKKIDELIDVINDMRDRDENND